MQDAGAAFSGVAFHCYSGTYGEQLDFYNAFPNKVKFSLMQTDFDTDPDGNRKSTSRNALELSDPTGGVISKWVLYPLNCHPDAHF